MEQFLKGGQRNKHLQQHELNVRDTGHYQETSETMMHGQGMHEGMQAQDLLMEKIWEDLTDDQKTQVIGRMIDAKIQMKESMIEHLKFKIDTFRMVRDFLCD